MASASLNRPPRWVVWAGSGFITAASAVEIAAAVIVGTAPWKYLADTGIAVVWTICGLFAWRYRPGSRIGLLMVLLGPINLLSSLWGLGLPGQFPGLSVLVFLSQLAAWIGMAVMAHLWISYPTGRIQRVSDRLLIRIAYGYALISGVGRQLILWPDPAAGRRLCGDRCSLSMNDSPWFYSPGMPAEIAARKDLYDAVVSITASVTLVLGVWVVGALVRRYITGTPRERRALTLPFGASVVATVFFLINILQWRADAYGPALYVATYVAVAAVPVAFLVGLLRDRLAFAAVGDLVGELGHLGPDRVQQGLAHALGDPSLKVLYPVGDSDQYVDVHGTPMSAPGDGSKAVTPLGDTDPPLAVLVHDPDLNERRDLLNAAGSAARLALENARLQAAVRAQLAEVRASRARLVDVADAERRRLERDLHDGAQQRLLGVGMTLSLLRGRLSSDAAADRLLGEATGELRSALQELRELAQGIHPAVLTDEGLPAALSMLARRCRLPVTVQAELSDRPPAVVEAAAYYLVSEALQNTIKHAQASHVTIRVCNDNCSVVVDVTDNGIGGADPRAGTGLRGLYDRINAINGHLTVRSPLGGGTYLHARLPTFRPTDPPAQSPARGHNPTLDDGGTHG